MARALNKIRGTADYYTRPADIEASIDEALTQDLDTVLRRANIRNPKQPGYMPLECLLHLAREARLKQDSQTETKLLRPLVLRCELLLKKAIPDGQHRDAENIRQDILCKFFELYALVGSNYDATGLDFFECRFMAAFASLRYERLRDEGRRKKVFVEFGVEKDDEGKPLDDENALAKLSAAAQSPARQENMTYLGQVLEFLKGASKNSTGAAPANQIRVFPDDWRGMPWVSWGSTISTSASPRGAERQGRSAGGVECHRTLRELPRRHRGGGQAGARGEEEQRRPQALRRRHDVQGSGAADALQPGR
jgi:hypothetical protein